MARSNHGLKQVLRHAQELLQYICSKGIFFKNHYNSLFPEDLSSSSSSPRVNKEKETLPDVNPPKEVLVEKMGLPSGLDCSSFRDSSDLMVKTGHRIITLEFDDDRKLMGVIVFSNIWKKSLLVKELQWALLRMLMKKLETGSGNEKLNDINSMLKKCYNPRPPE
ncbi:Calcium-transporting P-type ATPase, subfamily IIA, SERCA-type [Artemisia annua]|uniref:Calcium-transporting P-type ATPase, subfamily IIA, SERCA-type n=1 Tax=Artemisia annua TaxID=35608 RepID=A0A2U1QHG0_ARTAN|nr:Calcium-transporting P-type ATPase, subfamily IIA, SERCA-type [Artemisia annua]